MPVVLWFRYNTHKNEKESFSFDEDVNIFFVLSGRDVQVTGVLQDFVLELTLRAVVCSSNILFSGILGGDDVIGIS